MLTQEIIRKKRDGAALSKSEIEHIINGLMDGSVAHSQAAAFAMAVFFNGMDLRETQILTECILLSGAQLDWSDVNLPGPVVDKHSTGGLGDKVSLMIAPMLAAVGLYVPMISGRSLGHSGGTLDKMDSIPGYNTQPELERFQEVVADVGCAIVGQTNELAPADKILYSIRDITATVESIPLITASILSKKIAAGLDCLVLDVKSGSGSFNETFADAETLANQLVEVGNAYGMKTSACVTDMNQVLGRTMGNALEVKEAVEFLNGTNRNARLLDVTISLAAELMMSSKLSTSIDDAKDTLLESLASGRAATKFNDMVAMLGGPENFTETYLDYLPQAEISVPYYPKIQSMSYLDSMDGRALGNLVIRLGGGRSKTEDTIDYSVGFTDVTAIGEEVNPDQAMLYIHARSQADADNISRELDQIFTFKNTKLPPASPIMAIIRSSDYSSSN